MPSPLDIAWAVMKGPGAPNYRCPADDPKKSCGTCKYWDKIEGKIGKCKLFDFQCNASCTCDAWS